MPTFKIRYTVIEQSAFEVSVEAGTEEEAIRLVEEYEIDDTEAKQVGTTGRYERDNVEAVL